MPTFLHFDSTTLSLPDDLFFDESDFNPLVQSVNWSLDGICVIEEAVKVSGLKMVLSGGTNRSWISLETLHALLVVAQIPGKEMTLTLPDSRVFTVMWDRTDNKPVEYQEIWDVSLTNAHDPCRFWTKLKLITL